MRFQIVAPNNIFPSQISDSVSSYVGMLGVCLSRFPMSLPPEVVDTLNRIRLRHSIYLFFFHFKCESDSFSTQRAAKTPQKNVKQIAHFFLFGACLKTNIYIETIQ